MTKSEMPAIKNAAYKVLEEDISDYQIFSASEFRKLVSARCPLAERKHIASVIRPLWDYRLEPSKKCSFICVDKTNAIYKKVPLSAWDEKSFREERKAKELLTAIKILYKYGHADIAALLKGELNG